MEPLVTLEKGSVSSRRLLEKPKEKVVRLGDDSELAAMEPDEAKGVSLDDLEDIETLKEAVADVPLDLEIARPPRDPEGAEIEKTLPFLKAPPPSDPGNRPTKGLRGLFTEENTQREINRLKKLPSLSPGSTTRKKELEKIHAQMGFPEYDAWLNMLLTNGGTQANLEMAKEICRQSEPLYLEKAPPARPVVAPLRARRFNDHVDVDLWFTPGGGVSEYILHIMDSLTEKSVLEFTDTKDSQT